MVVVCRVSAADGTIGARWRVEGWRQQGPLGRKPGYPAVRWDFTGGGISATVRVERCGRGDTATGADATGADATGADATGADTERTPKRAP
jgi:hypothetical protein